MPSAERNTKIAGVGKGIWTASIGKVTGHPALGKYLHIWHWECTQCCNNIWQSMIINQSLKVSCKQHELFFFVQWNLIDDFVNNAFIVCSCCSVSLNSQIRQTGAYFCDFGKSKTVSISNCSTFAL